MTRWTCLAVSLMVALAFIAGTCDRVYAVGREASLSTWPDPACIDRALRAAPALGEVTTSDPHPSPDERQFTVYDFRVENGETHVSMGIDTDAAHQQMHIELYWSRMHNPPSEAELKQITGLMDQMEKRILECKGTPLPSAYERFGIQ